MPVSGGHRVLLVPDTPQQDGNHILAALDPPARQRLASRLESVQLPFGERLHEAEREVRHVYFPTSSVMSLIRQVENGDMAEVAICGREALIGGPAFLGDARSSYTTLVKRAGHAWRLEARHLREELSEHGRLERALLRYSDALIAQLVQSGVCNRLHNVEQRLSRCLLQLLDNQPGHPALELTHEFLAQILGVRRVGVTETTGRLQAAGALVASRGVLDIRDRAILEERSCECYFVVRSAIDQLLDSLSA